MIIGFDKWSFLKKGQLKPKESLEMQGGILVKEQKEHKPVGLICHRHVAVKSVHMLLIKAPTEAE